MSSAIKVVKRKDREAIVESRSTDASSAEQIGKREIVQTVKTWIAETRDRRQAERDLALQFMRGLSLSVATPSARLARTFLLMIAAGLLLVGMQGTTQAQASAVSSGDLLTLDQAIDMALHNNYAIKIAQSGVDKAD